MGRRTRATEGRAARRCDRTDKDRAERLMFELMHPTFLREEQIRMILSVLRAVRRDERKKQVQWRETPSPSPSYGIQMGNF